MKRILSVFLSVLLMIAPALAAEEPAAAPRVQDMVRQLILYYSVYGSEADEKTAELLSELQTADPVAGGKWADILQLWKDVNTSLEIHENILPDGLPDTDELCLVTLGFQLNPDGSMKNELIERLKVAKACAEKYPNALLVCTGCPTAVRQLFYSFAGVFIRFRECSLNTVYDFDQLFPVIEIVIVPDEIIRIDAPVHIMQ